MEGLGRGHGVLAGHGIDDQEGVVGSDGPGDVPDLVHQVLVDRQATGGVHDDHIGGMGARGGNRVEDDGGGIGARFLFYDFHAGAVGPDFQLLNGCRAKSVGGAEDYARVFFFQTIGELADGCCFAGAVHADDEDDARSYFGQVC